MHTKGWGRDTESAMYIHSWCCCAFVSVPCVPDLNTPMPHSSHDGIKWLRHCLLVMSIAPLLVHRVRTAATMLLILFALPFKRRRNQRRTPHCHATGVANTYFVILLRILPVVSSLGRILPGGVSAQRAHDKEKLGVFAATGNILAYTDHTTPPQCWTALCFTAPPKPLKAPNCVLNTSTALG